MRPKPTLTADRVREVLDYNPETGVFRWKVRLGQRCRVGNEAGSFSAEGYRQIKIDGRLHLAHRLAWLHTYGVWPRVDLDHRNEIKYDNRIANLREATKAQNTQNRSRARSDNQNGFMGVSRVTGGWRALIDVNGQRHNLGLFGTPEEAHAAYLAAKRELHPFWQEGKP